ncbi:hypothetical protein [uncultured Sulfitobacter sp.]|uniref:hypothetical protein n=1 Tax=uncultured Sulfitobacter sp. TaxID=191468 RepID=UPI0030DBE8A1
MFKVNQTPEFTRDVPVQTPDEEGYREDILKTRFRAIPVSEADAFDLSTGEGTIAFLKRVILRFENLVDDDEKPMTCTEALIDQLLDQAFVRVALVGTYFKGLHKSASGN